MKKGIHPEIKLITITCSTCNNEIKTTSVLSEIKADVCSSCHPFYTGKQISSSKAGRVDRFNKKLNQSK